MARVKRGVAAKRRHKKVLEQAKGYYGNKSRSFRAANEQVMHSGQYAFRDRRARKGEFRRLWIQRINAGDPPARHELQPVHRRAQRGRHRGRPQDPRRPRRHRRRPPSARLVEAAKARPRDQPSRTRSAFTSPEIQRLRRLLGRRSSRSEEGAFVVEGPLLVAEAVAAGWDVEAPVRGARASTPSTAPARCTSWRPGVAERISRHARRRPGLFAVVRIRPPAGDVLGRRRLRRRRRPGRRSRQPRHDPALGRGGRRRRRRRHAGHRRPAQPEGRAGVGRRAVPRPGRGRRAGRRRAPPGCASSARRRTSGAAHTDADWTGRLAIVAGSEAHGLADDAPVDEWVRIEHHGRAESLNVAMATTVLCFEAAARPPLDRDVSPSTRIVRVHAG